MKFVYTSLMLLGSANCNKGRVKTVEVSSFDRTLDYLNDERIVDFRRVLDRISMELLYCSQSAPAFTSIEVRQFSRLQLVVRQRSSIEPQEWLLNEILALEGQQHLKIRISAASFQVEDAETGQILCGMNFANALPPDQLLLFVVVGFNEVGEVIHERAFELRIMPSDEVLALLLDYGTESQASQDAKPLIGVERFFSALESAGIAFAGKTVLVSGCGTGGELMAIADLGASQVVGIEPDQHAFAIGRALTEPWSQISIVSGEVDIASNTSFDVVISRHVVEHVPDDAKRAYLRFLCRKLAPHATLFIEVPNQDCPIEQHTGLMFFHWLTQTQQLSAVSYFKEMVQHGTMDSITFDSYKRLVGHRNVSLDLLRNNLPRSVRIVKSSYTDSSFIFEGATASTLQVWVRKRELK